MAVQNGAISNNAVPGSIVLQLDGQPFGFRSEDSTFASSNQVRYERASGDTRSQLDLYFSNGTEWLTDPQFVKLGQLFEVTANAPTTNPQYRLADFVFGNPSAADAVPTTGSAAYSLTFRGNRASTISDVPLIMWGDGAALIDFETGRLDLQGQTLDFKRDGRPLSSTDGSTSISGSAAIGSDGLFANGTFSAISGVTGTYGGSLAGQFYGPDATEIGGTLIGDAHGLFISLAFAGFELPDVVADDTLANLTETKRLETVRRVVDLPNPTPDFSEAPIGEHIIFDADTGTYRVFGIFGGGGFGPDDRALGSDAQDLIAYETRIPLADGTANYEFALFDGSTQSIALSYTSFVRSLETITDSAGDPVDQQLAYFAFGSATPADQLPQTGTASYTGALFGDVTNGTQVLSPLRGSSSMQVDFGSMSLIGAIEPVATDLNGTTRDFGSFGFSGTIDSFTATFEALFGSAQGNLAGRFYGNSAQEFAATFGVVLPDEGLRLEGVTVGKQNPSAP